MLQTVQRFVSLAHSMPHVEYSIYTYDKYDDARFGVNKWQKYKTLTGLKRALNEAKVLHRTHKYQKIEIKKKACDVHQHQCISTTLKVFEHKAYNKKTAFMIGAALFSVIGAMLIVVLQ